MVVERITIDILFVTSLLVYAKVMQQAEVFDASYLLVKDL
jgi:hypothetical protein